MTYTHSNLIKGHTYTYRVSAENFLGYGATTADYDFAPRTVPGKPQSVATLDTASSDRTKVVLDFSANSDDGGSDLLQYSFYMDNGDDGAFSNGPYDITLPATLQFDSSAHAIALTAGLTYRFKFLANNAEGDGPLSDEVAVLVAEKPDTVATFTRTQVSTLSAGKIRVEWTAPADDGGSPIRGYKLYIDGVLTYDASEDSSATSYTATGLTVG